MSKKLGENTGRLDVIVHLVMAFYNWIPTRFASIDDLFCFNIVLELHIRATRYIHRLILYESLQKSSGLCASYLVVFCIILLSQRCLDNLIVFFKDIPEACGVLFISFNTLLFFLRFVLFSKSLTACRKFISGQQF